MSDAHHFTVSELLPDNRVFVATYTRINSQIMVIVDIYDDPTMRKRTRFLDAQLTNGQQLVEDQFK